MGGEVYQQTRLSDTSAVGIPGPVPYVVANWSDAELSNLDAMKLDPAQGLAGMGFWPVTVVVPAFDPASQVLVQPTQCDSVDRTARRWTASAAVRAMTSDEFLAANPVPQSVTNYQARSALRAVGLRTRVDAALRGADQSVLANAEALEAWDYANYFYRDQQFVVALGPTFGLSATDIDNLFRAAAKVP